MANNPARHGAQFAKFPTRVDAAEACHDYGIKVMMGAPNPIRGRSHSGNVAAHRLAAADLLDIMSSDNVPSGLLPAALMLGDLWGDVAGGIRAVTAAPAATVSLANRDHLALEAHGDLIHVSRLAGAAAQCGTRVQGRRVARSADKVSQSVGSLPALGPKFRSA